MTTTSTFQGMNTDSKPSSRVLNPPGGGSSNIFGGYEDNSAQQRTPVKNNPDNVNRGNNDIFHQGTHPAANTPHIRNNPDNVNRGSSDIFNQGTHAAAAASAPKSRAPRSAYNPITGECYDTEPPKTKQEAAAPVFNPQADGNSVKEEAQETAGAGARLDESNASKNQQASTQGGIFGNNSHNPPDHSSTRVSQPPGGKSTKLW
ncbi:unnamed protein product [Lymnaea stagnalis]|uniref:Microtubule-associated protein Jupiter n=1 Tax=Lymnaea stagnalis TaxID=6523 RepID=A0AAV2IGG3_LYMST